MSENPTPRQSREYMTNLLKRRSVIALCCSILTLVVAFYGIIAGFTRTDRGGCQPSSLRLHFLIPEGDPHGKEA